MASLASRVLMLGTLALLTACGPEAKHPALVGQQTDQAEAAKPAASSPIAPTQAPASSPAQPKAVDGAPPALIVNVGKANVREKPDTKAKILQVLSKGTKLTVVSKGHQWYRVRLDDGTQGWIAESVVTPARAD